LVRAIVLIAVAIGGFFVLAFSAAFAFFVLAGLVVFGASVFAFIWIRAKVLRKPFGPQAQFETLRKDMESQFQDRSAQTFSYGATASSATESSDGPILEAHQTPEGWSVEK